MRKKQTVICECGGRWPVNTWIERLYYKVHKKMMCPEKVKSIGDK